MALPLTPPLIGEPARRQVAFARRSLGHVLDDQHPISVAALGVGDGVANPGVCVVRIRRLGLNRVRPVSELARLLHRERMQSRRRRACSVEAAPVVVKPRSVPTVASSACHRRNRAIGNTVSTPARQVASVRQLAPPKQDCMPPRAAGE